MDKIDLDFPIETPYSDRLRREFNAYLQRQRAESGRSDEGRPDEGVSASLRELPLPSVYIEAINRPERAWAGFARADHLRTKTFLSQTRSQQRRASKGYPRLEATLALIREYRTRKVKKFYKEEKFKP